MALDPRIALGVQVADVGGALNNAILNAGRLQNLQQAQTINPLLQQRQQQQVQAGQQSIDANQFKNIATQSNLALNAINNGDEAGVVSAIQNSFPNDPARQQEAAQLFQSNPALFKQRVEGIVNTANQQALGSERFSPTTVSLPGGITVQETSAGRKVVSDAAGRELTGDAAIEAVRQAEKRGIELQKQRSAGRAEGVGEEGRGQSLINRGVAAAEGTATIRRSLELLKTIETGGIDAVSLAVQQRLGIEGADAAELSASLGKSVLSQLKETFGAAFTAQEGERLNRIEAGFGKSTAGNKRLLQQTLRIAERSARRGLKAARARRDTSAVEDIEDLLSFTLDVEEPGQAAATVSGGSFVSPGGVSFRRVP